MKLAQDLYINIILDQIGIVVGLLSTCIQSIGLTLQRKSHLLEDSKEDEILRRPAYRRRRWQIGMGLFVISNLVGSTIQITTLPLPVLSTLQASGLAFNTICATIVLGEPFTRWSFIGTALVAMGAVLIALFGALPEPSHSLDQLLELLERRQFILWMVATFIFMLFVLVFIFFLGRLHPEHSPRVRFWRGMGFGTLSGILSAHSLLVAKSAVELLVRTIVSHSNQFNRWQSWAILISLVFFALTQLYFLHRGLKLCSTSVLYPFVFCMYNIIAILDGLIYFKQTSRLPSLHAGLIAVGTVILLSGVLALSWRTEDDGSTPPPDVHTLLTPGMGIVEDTTTESSSGGSDYHVDSVDEEALVFSPTERTSLLHAKSATSHNGTMKVHKVRRQRFAPEIDNIWSEIQDDDPTTLRRATTFSSAPPFDNGSDADDDDNRVDPLESHKGIAKLPRAHTISGVTISTSARPSHEASNRRRRRWSSRYRSASTPLPHQGRHRSRTTSMSIRHMDGTVEEPSIANRFLAWWNQGRSRSEVVDGGFSGEQAAADVHQTPGHNPNHNNNAEPEEGDRARAGNRESNSNS